MMDVSSSINCYTQRLDNHRNHPNQNSVKIVKLTENILFCDPENPVRRTAHTFLLVISFPVWMPNINYSMVYSLLNSKLLVTWDIQNDGGHAPTPTEQDWLIGSHAHTGISRVFYVHFENNTRNSKLWSCLWGFRGIKVCRVKRNATIFRRICTKSALCIAVLEWNREYHY